MNLNFQKLKPIVSAFLVLVMLLISFSPLFSKKAEAQWVDWANLIPNTATGISNWAISIKEYALDAISYQMANLVIQRLSASTIKWINSGFKGKPAYVTDPEAYFLDLGDKMAGQFIFNSPQLNFLCGPMQAKIKLALTQRYINEPVWQCTLTDDVYGNMENFMDDFSNGGWDNFFELTQRQQNNPIGAFIQAENEMYAMISTRQETKKSELNWGQGFMSFEDCEIPGPDTVIPGVPGFPDDPNTPEDESRPAIPETRTPTCIKSSTVTPGSVIQNKLDSVLNISESKLVVADEINEIIGALLTQLTKNLVGGVGKGLKGLSGEDGKQDSNAILDSQVKAVADPNDVLDKYFNESKQKTDEWIYLGENPPDLDYCLENPDDPKCKGGENNNPDNLYIKAQDCPPLVDSGRVGIDDIDPEATVRCSDDCKLNPDSCLIPTP